MSGLINIDGKAYNLIKITEKNFCDYETIRIKKVLIDKYDNKYVLIDDENDTHLEGREASKPQAALNIIKINGSIKKEIKADFDDTYLLSELTEGEYNGYTYYYYKVIYKAIDNNNNLIINKINNFSKFVKIIQDPDNAYYIDVNQTDKHKINYIRLGCYKNNYIYQFNNLDELQNFNKKLFIYVKKTAKIHFNFSSNITNIKEKSFIDPKTKETINYLGFDID